VTADLKRSLTLSRRWPGALALGAGTLAVFFVVAAIGNGEAARGERVFSILDGAIGLVRGWEPRWASWLLDHLILLGWTITAAIAALASAGLFLARARTAVLVLLAGAVSLATWGQILLIKDRTILGGWLYVAGIICAIGLGVWSPMSRLPGFPVLPLPRDPSPPASRAGSQKLRWACECAVIFLLTLVGLLLRAYALNEFPQGFDDETIGAMVQSRTLHGLRVYMGPEFLSTAPGVVHLLTQFLFFNIFGTSICALRLTAVFWGTAAIPLFYWLVRRIAGILPAIASTVLFLAAAEQLFWSRTENTFFVPCSALALITAHLGLWMTERVSLPATAAAASWMPVCRYFFVPSLVMFLYPIALLGHAVIFVRGARSRILSLAPVLGIGVVMWAFSLSFVQSAMNQWHWRFVHPARVYGDAAWRKHGEAAFHQASFPELARLQTHLVLDHLGAVIVAFTYHRPAYTHWYDRVPASSTHRTWVNQATAVVFLLGVSAISSASATTGALLRCSLGCASACCRR
jgi:hypothetical protein